MPNRKKIEIVQKIKNHLQESKNFFVIENKGFSVNDIVKIRKELKTIGSKVLFFPNKVFRYGVEGLNIPEEYFNSLEGIHAVVFTQEDIKVAKILTSIEKEFEGKVSLKFAYIHGSVVNLEGIRELATLSSLEDMVAKIIYILKFPLQKLAIALQGISEKK